VSEIRMQLISGDTRENGMRHLPADIEIKDIWGGVILSMMECHTPVEPHSTIYVSKLYFPNSINTNRVMDCLIIV
jgi:hypothetical protein